MFALQKIQEFPSDLELPWEKIHGFSRAFLNRCPPAPATAAAVRVGDGVEDRQLRLGAQGIGVGRQLSALQASDRDGKRQVFGYI